MGIRSAVKYGLAVLAAIVLTGCASESRNSGKFITQEPSRTISEYTSTGTAEKALDSFGNAVTSKPMRTIARYTSFGGLAELMEQQPKPTPPITYEEYAAGKQ